MTSIISYFFMKGVLTNKIVDPLFGYKVMSYMLSRFPITFQLTLFAFFFLIVLGIPLGIISALKKDTWVDALVRIWALIGVSVPIFWLGYLFLYVFFYKYGVVSVAGIPYPQTHVTTIPIIDAMIGGEWNIFWENVRRFILPGFTLGFAGIGVIARLVRNSFLEAAGSDYIYFTKLRGLKNSRVLRHTLRNALVPVVTVLGLQFGGLLAGAPITETVFSIPGMGRAMVQSIFSMDFPVLIAGTLLIALIYIITNLVVDILYAVIDPRVRF
jgi:peptide/nickel transport system permease protein